jgi:ankyrin repeat protein
LENIIKEAFEKSMNDYPSVVRNFINPKDGNTLLIKVLKAPCNPITRITKDQYFRLISNENVNIKNKKGKTALYYAFRNNDHEMVKSLLEQGAIFDEKIKKKYKVKSYEMEQVLKSFNLF